MKAEAYQETSLKWLRSLILAFVFLNPLIFGLSDVLLIVLAVAGLVLTIKDRNCRSLVFSKPTLTVAFCFVWVFAIKLISTTWAVNPQQALDNAFNNLHFILWPFLLPVLLRSKLHPFAAERWLAYSFFLLLIFYAMVLWLMPMSEQADRFGGGWGSYGMLANVLVFFLLWILASLTRPKTDQVDSNKLLMWVSFFAGLLVLMSTKGRAEQLIFLVVGLGIILWRARMLLTLKQSVFAFILFFFGLSVIYQMNGDRLAEILPEVSSYMQGGDSRISSINTSMGGRMEIYRVAIEAIADKPFIGWGAGLRPADVPQYATDPLNPLHYKNFHNLYLQIILEIGFLGACVGLFFIGWAAYQIFQSSDNAVDSEIVLLLVILVSVFALKSLLNATFGYPLPNGIFVFFSSWFWLYLGYLRSDSQA